MSKRKTNKPRKTDASATGNVKPASTPISAPALTGSDGDELQASPVTETRLPELPGPKIDKDVDSTLPPVPPPELEAKPTLPLHLAEPKPDIALPVEARAEAEELVQAPTGETRTASSSSNADRPLARPFEGSLAGPLAGPLRAIAGIEACQTLFMEMARDHLDFAASLASMRSPFDMIDVATKFAGRQIGVYGRFSNAVVDIAAGRQAPLGSRER